MHFKMFGHASIIRYFDLYRGVSTSEIFDFLRNDKVPNSCISCSNREVPPVIKWFSYKNWQQTWRELDVHARLELSSVVVFFSH